MASRAEKRNGTVEVREVREVAHAPKHAAASVTTRVVETEQSEENLDRVERILKMVEEQRTGLKELTTTVGNNCVRLDRHRKDIDNLDHRVSALESRCPYRCDEPKGADEAKASELEEDVAAEEPAEKVPEPKVEEPEPEKPKFDAAKAFPEAPKGTVDWVYHYFYTYPAADGTPIWDSDESPNIAKQKGKMEYKAAVWVDKNRESLGKLTPEQARKYVPKKHS